MSWRSAFPEPHNSARNHPHDRYAHRLADPQRQHSTPMPAFRVIVSGAPGLRDFKALRDTLDLLLRDKLPDVAILTRAGAGYGTDALAASYAAMRGLEHVAYPLDTVKHAEVSDAKRARLAELVRDADAAVIVVAPIDSHGNDLAAACQQKGIPVRLLGARTQRAVEPEQWQKRRGLPD